MFRTDLSLDRVNRISTALVGVLVGGVILFALVRGNADAGRAAVILVVTFAICFAMSPRALVVDDGEVRIERRFWSPLRIPRAEVERASPLDSLGARVLRIGVGGYFGSFGLFRSGALGWFRLYRTRGGQAVRIRRRGALPIVVTPDDVAGAIHAIDRRPRIVAFDPPEPPADV
jgi:hypothetical protein